MKIGVATVLFSYAQPYIGKKGIQVALGRRIKEDGYGNWVLCGGKLDEGESPVDAAIREAREEFRVFLKKENVFQCHWEYATPPQGEPFLMLYFATVIEPGSLGYFCDEFDAVKWCKMAELNTLPMWTRDFLAIQSAYQQMF